jgi:serine/threonine protein kinase
MKTIKNPNLLSIFDLQQTQDNYYLFTEYCNGGDLSELLKIRGTFSEEEAKFILMQIINAFSELHKYNVIHRDLKLANIFV